MVRLVRILAGVRVVPACQNILLVANWKPAGDYESRFRRRLERTRSERLRILEEDRALVPACLEFQMN